MANVQITGIFGGLKTLLDGTEFVEIENADGSSQYASTEQIRFPIFAANIYGATGDGTTDDFTDITTCIAAAAAAGGGTVYLRAGDYYLSALLAVPSYVKLMGAGKGATSLRAGTTMAGGGTGASSIYGVVGCLGAHHATICDLTVDCVTNSWGTNGIVVTGELTYQDANTSEHCTVERCEVLPYDNTLGTATGYAIWNRQANGTRILNNVVTGDNATYRASTQQEGIEVFGGKDILVDGNHVTKVGNAGIYCYTDPSAGGVSNERIIITNNQVENCGQGINTSIARTFSGSDYITDGLTISGNQIKDCWEYGIIANQISAVSGPSVLAAKNINIVGNTIEITDGLAGAAVIIALWVGKSFVGDGVWQNVIIRGNIITGGEYWAGTSVVLTHFDGVQFLQNSITHNGNDDEFSYAVFINACDNCVVDGNLFKNINTSTLLILNSDNFTLTNNRYVNIGIVTTHDVNLIQGNMDGVTIFGNTSEHPAARRFVQASGQVTNLYAYGNKYINDSTRDQIQGQDAASCNFGTATIAANGATTTITNKLTEASAGTTQVIVNQVSGPLEPFMVSQVAGVATITRVNTGGTAAEAVYKYLII